MPVSITFGSPPASNQWRGRDEVIDPFTIDCWRLGLVRNSAGKSKKVYLRAVKPIAIKGQVIWHTTEYEAPEKMWETLAWWDGSCLDVSRALRVAGLTSGVVYPGKHQAWLAHFVHYWKVMP